MRTFIFISLFITTFCRAQQPGKTVVFKVRAQPTHCTISTDAENFFLETNNAVHLQLGGKNQNVKVVAENGQLMSSKGNTYLFRFLRSGTTVVSVYLKTPSGSKLIATKQITIKQPAVFFCGIEVDSSSRYLKMKGMNFYAYSETLKVKMPVVSFEMYYVDDTLAKRIEPVVLRSDSCMLSPAMRKTVFHFQPNHNYMYFDKIILQAPDGSKHYLDPVEFRITERKGVALQMSLIYSLRRKKL